VVIVGCSKREAALDNQYNQPIRFENGIPVYQLHCDRFADLSHQMKLYAYHLIQACKQGESLAVNQVADHLEQAFIYAPNSSREHLTELINQLRSGMSDLEQHKKLWLKDTTSQVDFYLDVSYSSDRQDTLFTGLVAIKETDSSNYQLLYSIDRFCSRATTVLVNSNSAKRFLLSNIPSNPHNEQRFFLMPTIVLSKNKMGGIKQIDLDYQQP